MELRLVYQLEGACLFDCEILDMSIEHKFCRLGYEVLFKFFSGKPYIDYQSNSNLVQLNHTFQLIPIFNFVLLTTKEATQSIQTGNLRTQPYFEYGTIICHLSLTADDLSLVTRLRFIFHCQSRHCYNITFPTQAPVFRCKFQLYHAFLGNRLSNR